MVPILNHSLFININNKIIKVILDIVIDKGLDITILLYLNSKFFIKIFLLLKIELEKFFSFNKEFILYYITFIYIKYFIIRPLSISSKSLKIS